MKPKILIVDDDSTHRKMLETVLSTDGYNIRQAEDGQAAIAAVEESFYDLILMDIRMNQIGGIEALKGIKEISPEIPIIMMTGYSSVSTAVDALKSGAYDYLTKPLDIDELKILVNNALHHHQLQQENIYLKERLEDRFDFSNIIGKSSEMGKLFETIALVAPSEATVLINGESGTGKELIANAIHQNSIRKEKPMIKVNCAALPETLLESELFGHEKGAFTGALKSRQGRFKLAHKGSIFLDEIGEMAPQTQAKILRVLQEREFEPVGSSNTIRVDTRVIAATNKNLKEEIKEGHFREDLFYRINVVSISVPPLRNRREDIPLLAIFFLKRYAEKNRRLIKGFTPRAIDVLMRYEWPGNIRELENMVERAVIMTRSDTITTAELSDTLQALDYEEQQSRIDLSPGRSLKDVEKEMILRTLEMAEGNRTHTAKILGISRRTLQLKLKEYGVN
ncbi:MAG: sigma-54-dependent Fis family transcriptional regulator [Desulfobacterales bacterium]|uniref:Sigma-54-dependent Fis family transcriptional regulator n=1 Tax=Candidatus Desulfatibia vada TaxID=2841696 RepID=A0A8J6TSZ7_9BACT|nr:sigma-54-dependent Fis family transcriptional regulator [Candidatus Desulfatibia vada]MBL6970689.1 sigma-54-dependent Fis family transcriptional regulator [Desulfobacterales bacterium]